MSPMLSLRDLLTTGADDRLAAVDSDLTRRALVDQALRFAAALQARHVRSLAAHLDDAAALATVLLGAWRANVRVIMPGDLQADSRERLRSDVDVIFSDAPEDASLHDWFSESPLAPAVLDLENTWLMVSTSGSSGQPKRIDKRLSQLDNEVAALEALWGPRLDAAVIVGSVSSQHIYGLLFRVLWPLAAGRPFVRHAQPYPEYLQRASLAHGRDGFAWVASPALLKRLGDNLDWQALSRVRRVLSSGGVLPAETATLVERRLGQSVCEIYGSSETGGIAWREGDALWTPFDGVRFVPTEDEGVTVESPYLPAGEAEPVADAIRLHADGRFELLGRLDRIVKLEEKRVSLPRLEQALAGHPWVADARLGVIQENRAFLGAVVALSEAGLHALRNRGRKTLTEALRLHLRDHCEALALPRRWRLVRHLPSNSQGKLPQRDIETLLAADRTRQPTCLSQERQDDQWVFTLEVPLDLAHFSGHFPVTPVLPGVVQVDWALSLAHRVMDLPPHFRGMEVLKFQQLVRPGDRVTLTLRFDAERGKLHFAYRNDEAACASGRILLEARRA